jgi:uncharacterized protein (TIGR00730 family)
MADRPKKTTDKLLNGATAGARKAGSGSSKIISPGTAAGRVASSKTGSSKTGNGTKKRLAETSDGSSVRTVCVYCGSGPGRNPAYAQAADVLGRDLAANGIGLVYGGGSLGLMGQTARAVLAHGGRVTGIIPQFLSEKEKLLKDVHESIITVDMHERKKLMYERSDAFVALPGGIGTLEELVEQLTWAQLGRHSKPIVLANIDQFWDPFLDLLAHMRDEAFIRAGLTVRFVTVTRADEIVPAILKAATARGSDDPMVKAITTQF